MSFFKSPLYIFIKKVVIKSSSNKTIPSFLIRVRDVKKQKAINEKNNFFLYKSLSAIIITYIKSELNPKYTATRPSAQPLNKYFPIVKKTIDKKIKQYVFFKNELIKINGGKNINKKEIFGKTSFQCPMSEANVEANAGASKG